MEGGSNGWEEKWIKCCGILNRDKVEERNWKKNGNPAEKAVERHTNSVPCVPFSSFFFFPSPPFLPLLPPFPPLSPFPTSLSLSLFSFHFLQPITSIPSYFLSATSLRSFHSFFHYLIPSVYLIPSFHSRLSFLHSLSLSPSPSPSLNSFHSRIVPFPRII